MVGLVRSGIGFLFSAFVTTGLLLGSASGLATSSTDLVLADAAPKLYQSDVDVSNCTAPIKSTPYIIIAGNGGANMQLSCPSSHPVMYSWHQRVGFGGFISVSSGGGRSEISCCAVKHVWVDMSA